MKTVRVRGASLVGTGAELVSVEARFERADSGATDVVLSGLPDSVIRESRGRWMCALKEARLALRPGKLYLNLVPSARRKTGGALDLPLALAAAAASGHLEGRALEGTLFLGELGIDGRLHAVPGGLAAAVAARAAGLEELVAPRATAEEAAWLPGARACAAERLGAVVAALSGAGPPLEPLVPREVDASPRGGPSLDDVRGQALAKRALCVAAAGAHGLLLVGPPGAGKSMLARRLIGLLPAPTLEERIEVTRVLSAAGAWPGGLVHERPFRAPHHTTSYAGLVGGGAPPQPGEITLAHRGLLFLDELPEFRREALEALREPLETGRLTLARAGARLELPARFQLVAAMNPCPCGYRGHPRLVSWVRRPSRRRHRAVGRAPRTAPP
ncbi:MAG: ATP-binding protein [Planctomycetes bacterium]|nr:ATP-binding protein [Planctomycetota bacterium]